MSAGKGRDKGLNHKIYHIASSAVFPLVPTVMTHPILSSRVGIEMSALVSYLGIGAVSVGTASL